MGNTKAFAVDTNVLAKFGKGDQVLARLLDQASYIGVPFVVVAEVRAGSLASSNSKQYLQFLEAFLAHKNVHILRQSDKTIDLFAEIYADCRRRGTPVSVHDYWIAACCLEHDLPLLTFDKDFRHIPVLDKVSI